MASLDGEAGKATERLGWWVGGWMEVEVCVGGGGRGEEDLLCNIGELGRRSSKFS